MNDSSGPTLKTDVSRVVGFCVFLRAGDHASSSSLELLARFEPDATYRETEVNAILREVQGGVANLRQEIDDYRLLECDGVGSYRGRTEVVLGSL